MHWKLYRDFEKNVTMLNNILSLDAIQHTPTHTLQQTASYIKHIQAKVTQGSIVKQEILLNETFNLNHDSQKQNDIIQQSWVDTWYYLRTISWYDDYVSSCLVTCGMNTAT